MKRYIAVLEIDNDKEIVGSIDATVPYTYHRNGTIYATYDSVRFKSESEGVKSKTYEDGLKEAWELARRIACMPEHGGETLAWMKDVFGDVDISTIMRDYSVSEVIEKVKEHEEIKVGDEVECYKGLCVVLNFDEDSIAMLMKSNGKISNVYDKTVLKKTGRHFPQIEEVLKQMQMQENEG